MLNVLPYSNLDDRDLRQEEINYRQKRLEEMMTLAEDEIEDEQEETSKQREQARNYYTKEEVKTNLEHYLSIVHINARSIRANIDEVENLMKYTKADIFCVTETWLKEG